LGVGDSWATGGLPHLNVLDSYVGTHALGPGLRSVVWVQGCRLRCPGCMTSDGLSMVRARLVDPEELAREVLGDSRITGLTFSGGEPMLQAAGLAALARAARSIRPAVDILAFSGYTLEVLRSYPPAPGVAELLAELDVLIDGPYIERENDGRGLRGSANQRIHRLTTHAPACSEFDFEHGPRRAEIRMGSAGSTLLGVPPHGVRSAFDHALADRPGRFLNEGGEG
jgi:anaerobic ribonucleoside-triphosphate reductase activating protein